MLKCPPVAEAADTNHGGQQYETVRVGLRNVEVSYDLTFLSQRVYMCADIMAKLCTKTILIPPRTLQLL